MAEVFNPLIYGHPVLDYNFRTIARILNNITSGEGIPTTRITDDAIDGTKIADASVDTEHLVAAAVTAAKIEALTITAAQIAALTITAAEIAANTITAAEIAVSTITATELNVTTLSAIAANVGTLTAGTITSGVALGAAWRKIYDTDIATKCTSVTLSSLDGDTDKEYLIIYRWIDDDAEASFGIRPNNASGASDYGWESLYATGASGQAASCWQDTSFSYIYAGRATPGNLSQGYTRLYAKSGYDRSAHGMYSRSALNTTVTGFYVLHSLWNESSTNITSLVFFADQTEEIGPGTHIEVWKRVD